MYILYNVITHITSYTCLVIALASQYYKSTRYNELASGYFELVSRYYELASRYYELVSRYNELASL